MGFTSRGLEVGGRGATLSSLRVAVVGTGAMGRNHVRILSSLPGVELVGVHDPDPKAGELGVKVFDRLEDLAGEIDAAVVAAPTVAHADIGCFLLQRRVHVLVEKPIASSLAEADRLLEAQGDRVLAVGHVEFYNPAVQALEKIQGELAGDPAVDYLVGFIETAKRGIHKSKPRGGRTGGDAE